MTLEQELVRAEAENLVAEAQLTNITRQKLKEAYGQQINAIVERSEKQVILAKHARRLLSLLDDSPVVPGADRAPYENERPAKEILLDAEEELGKWEPGLEPCVSPLRLENNPPLTVETGAAQEAEQVAMGSAGEHGSQSQAHKIETGVYPNDPNVHENAT